MSDPLDQLKQWRETTEKASEGPWPVNGSRFGEVGQVWGLNWRNDIEFIAAAGTAMPALLTAIENVLKLHRAFNVYDECECTEDQKDDGYHTEVNDIGLTCNQVYTVCGECCTADEYVTEECSWHVHRDGEPICPTVAAIRDALGGAK